MLKRSGHQTTKQRKQRNRTDYWLFSPEFQSWINRLFDISTWMSKQRALLSNLVLKPSPFTSTVILPLKYLFIYFLLHFHCCHPNPNPHYPCLSLLRLLREGSLLTHFCNCFPTSILHTASCQSEVLKKEIQLRKSFIKNSIASPWLWIKPQLLTRVCKVLRNPDSSVSYHTIPPSGVLTSPQNRQVHLYFLNSAFLVLSP